MAQMTLRLPSPSIRIEPDRLMGMLLWGIVCGAALGLLWDVFRLTRVMLGVNYPTRRTRIPDEKRPLPLLGRPAPSRTGADTARRRWLCSTVIFCEDILFGVICGVVMTLLVYITNDGTFRIMAPAGMLCGFIAYYLTVGRLVLSLSQAIIYFLRVLCCYAVAAVLLPFRLTVTLWKKTVGTWATRVAGHIRQQRAMQYHENMLRQLNDHAKIGWVGERNRKSKKGGCRYAIKQKTRQENDHRIAQYADLSGADRALCHHLFCDQADGEQQAQKGAGRSAGQNPRRQAKGVRFAVRHRRARG
jgi:hypothetical protein